MRKNSEASSAPARPSHLRKKYINPTASTPDTAAGTRAVKSLAPNNVYDRANEWNCSGPCIKGVCTNPLPFDSSHE